MNSDLTLCKLLNNMACLTFLEEANIVNLIVAHTPAQIHASMSQITFFKP